MLFIYTSAYRETYFDAVRKVLTLPKGASQRFIYDDKYVHPEIIKNRGEYIGKEGIILYIQRNGNLETSIPLRKVVINDIIVEEDIVVIDFIHTDEYWQPVRDPASTMRRLMELKQSNNRYFVFEGDDPGIKLGKTRKELFHFLLSDPNLREANGKKINLIYSINVIGADGAERGIIRLRKGKEVVFRIYFYSAEKNRLRGMKIFTHLGKVEFPVDYDENDLRSGIIDFIAYPLDEGLESITVDVDDGYRTTFIVEIM